MTTTPMSYAWPMQALPVHEEDGTLWTECAMCPGFSAAASSFGELYRLVSERHVGKTHGWLLIQAATEPTTTNSAIQPA